MELPQQQQSPAGEADSTLATTQVQQDPREAGSLQAYQSDNTPAAQPQDMMPEDAEVGGAIQEMDAEADAYDVDNSLFMSSNP